MPLLEIKNLVKKFPIKEGLFGRVKSYVHALQGIDLVLEEGKTLGLVGESGCGKTTLARIILHLLAPDSGEVLFQGEDLQKLSSKKLRALRKSFQIVFQDPYSSLNPRMTIATTLSESWVIQGIGGKEEREERVAELLKMVGLAPEAALKYPHEFSGGQRQRIGIARALSLLPKLIVCDEPVSALDVSIQSQILNLLMELKQKFSLTYLFISHDLKVVQHVSDEIAVMYLGRIVEQIPSSKLSECKHPYTQALLLALPTLVKVEKKDHQVVQGEVPSPVTPPSGCAFHPRCPYAEEICKEKIPMLEDSGVGHPVASHFVTRHFVDRHLVACHLADKIPKVQIG